MPTEVKIGVVLPLSGRQVDVGEALLEGYRFAEREVAARGLELSEFQVRVPVRLVVYDDQGDPDLSRQHAARLIDYDRVDVLLGGAGLAVGAQIELAERRGVPLVLGLSPEGLIPRKARFVFGGVAPRSRLAASLIAWLTACQDEARLPRPLALAVVYPESPSGERFAADLRARIDLEKESEATPQRFDLTLAATFPKAPAGYRALLQTVRDAQPDVVLVDAGPVEAIVMQREAVAIGARPAVVSYGFTGSERVVRAQLGAAADKLVSGVWWSPALRTEAAARLAEGFAATVGYQPDALRAQAYGAYTLVWRAIEQAGWPNPDRVREALAARLSTETTLPGLAADTTVGGLPSTPLLLVQNRPDGSHGILWPPRLQTAEPLLPGSGDQAG